MSRANYTNEGNTPEELWSMIRWRGAVTSAIRGKRGQAFLKELLATLDAMPEKKLITKDLVDPQGEVCTIGALMVQRGIDASSFDDYDAGAIASAVGIAPALVREIEYMNDDMNRHETPEERHAAMRQWIASEILQDSANV